MEYIIAGLVVLVVALISILAYILYAFRNFGERNW
jgi:hypothetical protein